jgi:hypothetical protein
MESKKEILVLVVIVLLVIIIFKSGRPRRAYGIFTKRCPNCQSIIKDSAERLVAGLRRHVEKGADLILGGSNRGYARRITDN